MQEVSSVVSGDIEVNVKNLVLQVKVASTADVRKKGLSNIDSLPINEGMLFVFDQKGRYSFWMKDMKFPIDIIWIDENKKIVNISKNAIPEPKKADKDLTKYDSSYDVKYVLEINAGLAGANNLQIGDLVNFSL